MTGSACGRRHDVLAVVLLVAVALAACAHQPTTAAPGAPGFLAGLLHGFLILFSLIGSLFTPVRIYAFPNSGIFYDVGYVLGAAAFLGGAGSRTR